MRTRYIAQLPEKRCDNCLSQCNCSLISTLIAKQHFKGITPWYHSGSVYCNPPFRNYDLHFAVPTHTLKQTYDKRCLRPQSFLLSERHGQHNTCAPLPFTVRLACLGVLWARPLPSATCQCGANRPIRDRHLTTKVVLKHGSCL